MQLSNVLYFFPPDEYLNGDFCFILSHRKNHWILQINLLKKLNCPFKLGKQKKMVRSVSTFIGRYGKFSVCDVSSRSHIPTIFAFQDIAETTPSGWSRFFTGRRVSDDLARHRISRTRFVLFVLCAFSSLHFFYPLNIRNLCSEKRGENWTGSPSVVIALGNFFAFFCLVSHLPRVYKHAIR